MQVRSGELPDLVGVVKRDTQHGDEVLSGVPSQQGSWIRLGPLTLC